VGSLAYRSLFYIDNTDIYFTKANLLLAEANTAGAAADSQENLILLERIRARLEKVEGVTTVSYATAAPPHDHGWMELPVQAIGSERSALSDGTVVGPEYIASLGVPELSGRDISANDIIEGRPTAVINRKLAEALWPGEPATGKGILLGEGKQPIEVVGVVPNGAFSGVAKDGSFEGIGAASRPNFIFLSQPRESSAPGPKTFHIRYRGDLDALLPRIRSAVREIDGRIPVFSVRTMDQEFSSFTAPIRIITFLIAAFAISALVLSYVGLYAAVAFHTQQRTREFGIRAALGGTPRQLMRMVLEQSLTIAISGIAIGLVLAAVIGKAGSSLLLGVNPTHALTYAVVAAALIFVMLTACYGPARRASRMDPMQALRDD
jgi:MacB-like periplasmic core domain/FtsX-like permease family